ncbi:cupin domain-containing protein [Nitratireductor soli]|uniref:cupin domain-containing protein n=1 Tax=Nitratireductor soli TaxID=1670619 RepID=UPI00065E097F|nr:cupin domain-containing protein [Nitratireductor soli]
MTIQVGQRIRKFRKQRDLVIDDLADKSGLSRAYISQVETGKALPSLTALESLAQALEIPISYLFVDDTFNYHITRKDDRQVIIYGLARGKESQRKRINMLSAPNRQLEMVLLEIPPGYDAADRDHSHDGEECHLVMEGTIRATQGDESYVLYEGDSYHWDGSIPHRVENIGEGMAKLLIARTPAGFLTGRFVGKASSEEEVPQVISDSDRSG